MRLICTIKTDASEENPYEFSYFLTEQGIENECEQVSAHEFRIWSIEEDQMDDATELYESYRKDPKNSKYHTPSLRQTIPLKMLPRKRAFLSPAPYGPLTIFFLLIVIGLFVYAQFGRETQPSKSLPEIIQAPTLSPVERLLIYDYPPYFQKLEELRSLPDPSDNPSLIWELQTSTTWMGIYDRLVTHLKNPVLPLFLDGPLFVKIRQGEVWRLITPALLHFNLLHIFFNVLWFILLGNQIEFRIRSMRYLALIFATGIVSNTAQYLVSGPFFMGLSGVICGMAAFIWARQQVAPWEGYLLHPFTLIFLAIFVLGMFGLQTVFFFLQIFGNFQLTVGIANTAHLTGALTGYLLGRSRFFAIPPRK